MKRILITGGTGFFGKSMLDYRLRHPEREWPEWVILSRDPKRFIVAQSALAVQTGVSFIAGDIQTFDPPKCPVDAIVHAAAVLDSSCAAEAIVSTTVNGTRRVVEVAKAMGCPRILYTSSGAVYGSHTGLVSEDVECRPSSLYGKAKLEAEGILRSSGLDVKMARCFSFVGRYLDRTIYYAIGNFIQNCIDGQPIVIKGDGTPMRSYLYADDLVEWLFAILARGESGRPYNVGSNEAVSIRDLAFLVRDTLQSNNLKSNNLPQLQSNNQTISNQTISPVRVLGQSVPGAANYYVPNVQRAREELGVEIRVGLKDAILRSVSFSSGGVHV